MRAESEDTRRIITIMRWFVARQAGPVKEMPETTIFLLMKTNKGINPRFHNKHTLYGSGPGCPKRLFARG